MPFPRSQFSLCTTRPLPLAPSRVRCGDSLACSRSRTANYAAATLLAVVWLLRSDTNPQEWEEHVGFLSHDQRPYLEPLLTTHYKEFTVMPWFAAAPSEVSLESSGRAHPRQ